MNRTPERCDSRKDAANKTSHRKKWTLGVGESERLKSQLEINFKNRWY